MPYISKDKQYHTRKEKYAVTVLATDLKGTDHPVVAVVHQEGYDVAMAYTQWGRWTDDLNGSEHQLDLLEVGGSTPSRLLVA